MNAAFTSHIVDMERGESERLLDLLYRQATVPEYQCRFRWRPHSVAFWDNRAVAALRGVRLLAAVAA